MQSTESSFKVTSARLTPTGRFIIAEYEERISETPQITRDLSAQAFGSYLNSRGVTHHSVEEYMLRAKKDELHQHVAGYMEAMMESAVPAMSHEDAHHNIGAL